MKTTRFLILPLLCLALRAATPALNAAELNTLSAEEKAAGWQLLFNGKNTEGWLGLGKNSFPDKGWEVSEGILRHTQSGGGGDIVTAKTYINFELSFEWKIGAAGNSGVKYNLPDASKPVGFEYQLLDDERNPDGVKNGALHQTGSLYDIFEPNPARKTRPVGEWNQSRLLVQGRHVEHWLNGSQAVSFDLGSPELLGRIAKSKYKNVPGFGEKKASPLLLQDHGDLIEFRNLKLRELK
jgi:hypothetical protein